MTTPERKEPKIMQQQMKFDEARISQNTPNMTISNKN